MIYIDDTSGKLKVDDTPLRKSETHIDLIFGMLIIVSNHP